jgi:ADP-ribosyl-[dinitrogen reductase] hydrolase
MNNSNSLDKIRGMLIGAAIGDSLGSPHEMKYNKKVPYSGFIEIHRRCLSRFHGSMDLELGQLTDDTEMTLALTRSLVRNGGYDRDDVVSSYISWANSGSFMMGKNTKALFHGIKTNKGYEKRYSTVFDPEKVEKWTQSNGCLMRCSPLALLKGDEAVINDCKLTNPHIFNIQCCLAYIHGLRAALESKHIIDVIGTVSKSITNDSLSELWCSGQNGVILDMTNKESKGWAGFGIYSVSWCLGMYTTFQEAMDWVIGENIGSDTDTNACIVGAMMGAHLGFDAMCREEKTGHNMSAVLACRTKNSPLVRPEEYTLGDFYDLTEKMDTLYKSQ